MYGFTVARPEFSKQGKPMTINVIDKDGNEFTDNIGNGSVCNIKMFAYRNQDDQAVVMLDTVQVIEHVPYEAKGGSGSVEDDVLGVTYKTKKAGASQEAVEEQKATKKQSEPEVDDFDDQIPF